MELERYLAGDLDAEARQAFERRMSEDPELAARVRERRADKQAFLHDPRRKRFAEILDDAEVSRKADQKRLDIWGALATAVGTVIVSLIILPVDSGVRTKGSFSLQVALLQDNAEPVPYEAGAVLHPKDRLRLSVDDSEGGYVTVLLEEQGGVVEVLYEASEVGELAAGRHALPGSLQLDERLGRERLYVLITPNKPKLQTWLQEIRRAHDRSGFDHGWLPEAPARLQTLDYTKVER